MEFQLGICISIQKLRSKHNCRSLVLTTISFWKKVMTLRTGFNYRTIFWSTGTRLALVIRFTVTLLCPTWTIAGTSGWLNSSKDCTTVIGITSSPFDFGVAFFAPPDSPWIFDQPIVNHRAANVVSSPTNCKNWMIWRSITVNKWKM